jgi:glycosyltransferase involved in cell wall biosynthesis
MQDMKVLVCHNYYQQPGGEDLVFSDECSLLQSHGHEVIRFTQHNDNLAGIGRWAMLKKTIWNQDIEGELLKVIRRERPQVMHCHNTFPMISPAAYYAARRENVAVVQTLHNFRLLCPGATLLRDGRVCEKCVGKRFAWPAIQHACYRNSRPATAAVTAMLSAHHARQTWTHAVDRYIALTEFSRDKFIEGGLPAERISVKPNFVQPDPGVGRGAGGYAVFVGRLAPEKGIATLLDAWAQLSQKIPLRIIGDGPLAPLVQQATENNPQIEWLGRRPFDQVTSIVGAATVLVMPSVWYETFGRTVVEAFATGTPVIASRMGAMQELVDEGRTGLLFEPGDSADLAAKVQRLWDRSDEREPMRQAARDAFEQHFTAQANYPRLMEIYREAIISRGGELCFQEEAALEEASSC